MALSSDHKRSRARARSAHPGRAPEDHSRGTGSTASPLPAWAPLSWKAVLGLGAVIVFVYAASINYFPDLDLGTSAALFAAVALFGTLVFVLLGVTFSVPAYMWHQAVGASGRLGRALLGGPHSWRRAGWMAIPLVVLLAAVCVVLLRVDPARQGWWLVGVWLLVSLGTGAAAALVIQARLGKHARVSIVPSAAARPGRRHWRRTRLACVMGWATALSASVLSVPAAVLLALSPPVPPGATLTDDAVTRVFLVVLVVLLMNAALVVEPRPTPARLSGPSAATVALRWRLFTGAMSVVIVLTAFGRWTFLSERVMWRFGLGGIEHAALVLDKSGCAIAQAVGVLDAPAPDAPARDAETCRLDDVTIDLRVGTTYVLRVPRADSDAVPRRFSIPRDRVLSAVWPPEHQARGAAVRGTRPHAGPPRVP